MNKKQEYQKEYYKKNKDYCIFNSKLYYKLNKEAKKKKEEEYYRKYPEKAILRSAKQTAKVKQLEFNLALSDIQIPSLCPILKIPFSFNRREGKRFNGPSLDRIDPSKGYIKGNVWVISDLANRMKQNATVEQLKQFGEWTRTL